MYRVFQQRENTFRQSQLCLCYFVSTTYFGFCGELKHVKGKGKGHPKTGHEGPRGEWRYSSILSLTSALDAGGWSTPPPGHFIHKERHSVPIAYETGWAPGPVWTGAENLAPTGCRSPDRPSCRESQYRLSFCGPQGQLERLTRIIENLHSCDRRFVLPHCTSHNTKVCHI